MNGFNFPGGLTGFDFQETKLPTYWNTPFTKICLGMKIGQQDRFLLFNYTASSLHSLIADGRHRETNLGRDTWKTLIGGEASLEANCNKEGFNAVCSQNARARIGIISNDHAFCGGCESSIGFGTGWATTCGNKASTHADNGQKDIPTMGYILIQ